MKLAEGELPLATYPSAAPTGRGEQATLTQRRLVWLRGNIEEHFPLDKVTCVKLGFERSTGRMLWGSLLLLFAINLGVGLGWAQANLPTLIDPMVKTLADHESPARIASAQRAYAQRVDWLMLLIIPAWGLAGAAAMYALWLGYTGVRGETRVLITQFAVTRTLSRRGRDPRLLEFGERVAQQAAGLEPRVESGPAEQQNLIDWIPTRPTPR